MRRLLIVSYLLCIVFLLQGQTQERLFTPRKGLPNFLHKLKEKKPVTIAYLGGSITEAEHGYRIQMEQWFKKSYSEIPFTMINAAIGGTGSDLGVVRINEDVLEYKPDLVFVEFAVNDGNTDSLKILNSMEGIVRKIWKRNSNTDICFLYTTKDNMLFANVNGLHWRSANIMEQIADYYQIPTVSMDFAVAAYLKNKRLIVKGEKDKVYGNKIVFTYDGTHPTAEGHKIYTDAIIQALGNMPNLSYDRILTEPISKENYEYSGMYPITDAHLSGDWQILGKENSVYRTFEKRLPVLICGNTSNNIISVRFRGRLIGFYDVIGPSTATLKITVDEKEPFTIQRFDKYCSYYRSHYFWLPELEEGEHIITMEVAPVTIDKMNLLSEEDASRVKDDFNKMNIYLGKIMIVGELRK